MSVKDNPFANEIVFLWRDHDAPDAAYFDMAETEDWTRGIWEANSPFQKLMAQMDLRAVAEIACGRGRHAAHLLSTSDELYLIDTSVAAIQFARERFEPHAKVKVILSEDGQSLPNVPDNHLTAVFSFDAMVHFEPLTIAAYLSETARVLRPGGRALIHHSNYSQNPTGTIKESPGWRNYMTEDLFAHFASRAGLRIVDRSVISWAGPDSDALTLLEK